MRSEKIGPQLSAGGARGVPWTPFFNKKSGPQLSVGGASAPLSPPWLRACTLQEAKKKISLRMSSEFILRAINSTPKFHFLKNVRQFHCLLFHCLEVASGTR